MTEFKVVTEGQVVKVGGVYQLVIDKVDDETFRTMELADYHTSGAAPAGEVDLDEIEMVDTVPEWAEEYTNP